MEESNSGFKPRLYNIRVLAQKTFRNSAFKYLLVGGLSFLLDYGLLYLFHEIIGIRLWISTGISFLASFFFNFTLQKMFAFNSQKGTVASLAMYLLLVIFNAFATVAIVSFLYSFITWQIAKIVATILTTVWNYLIYKYVIFSNRPPKIKGNN